MPPNVSQLLLLLGGLSVCPAGSVRDN